MDLGLLVSIGIVVGIILIISLLNYKIDKAPKIPVFPAEPPFKYEVIGESSITGEGINYKLALIDLSRKAFKLKVDAIKDLRITTFKKSKDDEEILLVGVPVKKLTSKYI